MIGSWVVYSPAFRGRYVAREVVGETKHFWVVQSSRPDGSIDEIGVRKVKKNSMGAHAFFEREDEARSVAKNLSDELLKIGKDTQQKESEAIKHFLRT